MDVVGIDLAKLTFDATLLTISGAQHHQTFANTPQGFTDFGAWLKCHKVSQAHLCMEATNIYVRRITARAIPPAGRMGSEGGPMGQQLTSRRKPTGTAAC
jgi:transposase